MAKLADYLDVDINTVWRWRAGQRVPSLENQQKICERYGCTFEILNPDLERRKERRVVKQRKSRKNPVERVSETRPEQRAAEPDAEQTPEREPKKQPEKRPAARKRGFRFLGRGVTLRKGFFTFPQ
jgi:transcriptional regulator with XRE-family HTH domain